MRGAGSKPFGGQWSDEKLDALKSYLSSYTTALKKAPFKRAYIDAFAGAGTREMATPATESFFDPELNEDEIRCRHGSPLIALATEPAFDSFIFIERDPASITKLREERGGSRSSATLKLI